VSKNFVFRLDAALRQRAREEQDARMGLARAMGAQAAAQAELEALARALLGAAGAAVGTGAPFDPASRINALYYRDRTERQVEGQRRVVGQRARETESARALLAQVTRRRRVLERLRERREREFLAERNRRMMVDMDELVTLRYGGSATRGEGTYGY